MALTYALLGTLFIGLAAALVIISGANFWDAITGDDPNHYFFKIGGVAVGHWALAFLSLRYATLSSWWKGATFAVSLILALWNISGAVNSVIHGGASVVSFVPAPAIIGSKCLLAFAYSVCAYVLWSNRRIPGNRLERPVAASASQGEN